MPEAGAEETAATPSPAPAGCTGGDRYKTCTSAIVEATGVDLVKTGTALCPGGYVALGGGYEGSAKPVKFTVFVVCGPDS